MHCWQHLRCWQHLHSRVHGEGAWPSACSEDGCRAQVNWSGLWTGWVWRDVRQVIVLVPIILGILAPVGVASGEPSLALALAASMKPAACSALAMLASMLDAALASWCHSEACAIGLPGTARCAAWPRAARLLPCMDAAAASRAVTHP